MTTSEKNQDNNVQTRPEWLERLTAKLQAGEASLSLQQKKTYLVLLIATGLIAAVAILATGGTFNNMKLSTKAETRIEQQLKEGNSNGTGQR